MLDEWIRKSEILKGTKDGIPWNRNVKLLLALLVSLGLLALLWPASRENASPNQTSSLGRLQADASARTALTAELQSVLSQVEGAGVVTVSLTTVSDGVKSYARNTRNENRDTRELDTSGGERNIKEDNVVSDVAVSAGKALLIEDKAPEVVGVLVIAKGAADARVKERLTDVTATLLHLYPNQVRVVAGEGGK